MDYYPWLTCKTNSSFKSPVQLFTDEKIITLYKLNLTFNIFSNPTPRLKVEDVKQELIQLLQTVQDDETVIHQLATLVKKVHIIFLCFLSRQVKHPGIRNGVQSLLNSQIAYDSEKI